MGKHRDKDKKNRSDDRKRSKKRDERKSRRIHSPALQKQLSSEGSGEFSRRQRRASPSPPPTMQREATAQDLVLDGGNFLRHYSEDSSQGPTAAAATVDVMLSKDAKTVDDMPATGQETRRRGRDGSFGFARNIFQTVLGRKKRLQGASDVSLRLGPREPEGLTLSRREAPVPVSLPRSSQDGEIVRRGRGFQEQSHGSLDRGLRAQGSRPYALRDAPALLPTAMRPAVGDSREVPPHLRPPHRPLVHVPPPAVRHPERPDAARGPHGAAEHRSRAPTSTQAQDARANRVRTRQRESVSPTGRVHPQHSPGPSSGDADSHRSASTGSLASQGRPGKRPAAGAGPGDAAGEPVSGRPVKVQRLEASEEPVVDVGGSTRRPGDAPPGAGGGGAKGLGVRESGHGAEGGGVVGRHSGGAEPVSRGLTGGSKGRELHLGPDAKGGEDGPRSGAGAGTGVAAAGGPSKAGSHPWGGPPLGYVAVGTKTPAPTPAAPPSAPPPALKVKTLEQIRAEKAAAASQSSGPTDPAASAAPPPARHTAPQPSVRRPAVTQASAPAASEAAGQSHHVHVPIPAPARAGGHVPPQGAPTVVPDEPSNPGPAPGLDRSTSHPHPATARGAATGPVRSTVSAPQEPSAVAGPATGVAAARPEGGRAGDPSLAIQPSRHSRQIASSKPVLSTRAKAGDDNLTAEHSGQLQQDGLPSSVHPAPSVRRANGVVAAPAVGPVPVAPPGLSRGESGGVPKRKHDPIVFSAPAPTTGTQPPDEGGGPPKKRAAGLLPAAPASQGLKPAPPARHTGRVSSTLESSGRATAASVSAPEEPVVGTTQGKGLINRRASFPAHQQSQGTEAAESMEGGKPVLAQTRDVREAGAANGAVAGQGGDGGEGKHEEVSESGGGRDAGSKTANGRVPVGVPHEAHVNGSGHANGTDDAIKRGGNAAETRIRRFGAARKAAEKPPEPEVEYEHKTMVIDKGGVRLDVKYYMHVPTGNLERLRLRRERQEAEDRLKAAAALAAQAAGPSDATGGPSEAAAGPSEAPTASGGGPSEAAAGPSEAATASWGGPSEATGRPPEAAEGGPEAAGGAGEAAGGPCEAGAAAAAGPYEVASAAAGAPAGGSGSPRREAGAPVGGSPGATRPESLARASEAAPSPALAS
eukprot:jgi/Botrbrau1/5023/Bobra.0396s0037.2